MIVKLLNNIQVYLFFWILGAIILGLSFVKMFGGYAFTPIICLFAALIMIYPSLVPLDFSKLKSSLKEYRIIISSLLFNFIFLPLLTFVVGYIFLQNYPLLWLGLILLAFLPGGGMATTWAQRSNADMATTVGIIFFNLIAAVIITPFALSFSLNQLGHEVLSSGLQQSSCLLEDANRLTSCFLGGDTISPIKILIPVIFIIIFPALLAYFTQKTIKRNKGEEYFNSIKNNFAKFSNLGLIIILFALMAIKNNLILFTYPDMVLMAFWPLAIFYVFNILASLFVYRYFFRNSHGKAFVWGSYLRYITLSLGLGISMVYQNPALFLIIIPIILSYLIQIPSSFVILKYFNKLK